MVLSAFPRNMRLPDPFTPNLKIDQLPEIIQLPKGATTNLNPLASTSFKTDLDSYLRLRSPVTFLSDLRGHLQLPANQTNKQVDGTRYNVQLMNALVFYVGQSAIASINPRNINMTTIAHSSHMDIFQNLAVDLDTQGMSHCDFYFLYHSLFLFSLQVDIYSSMRWPINFAIPMRTLTTSAVLSCISSLSLTLKPSKSKLLVFSWKG